MVLASTRDNTPIDELVQLADKVMEVAIPTVSKLTVQPSTHDFESLQGEISSLRQEIKTLQQAARNQVPRHRSPSPHCYPSSLGSDHSSTLCWYHQKFGTVAKKCRSTCSYLGATSVAGHHLCRLLYVTDRMSGLHSLVDTEGEVSIVPPSASDRNHHKTTINLQAVNNTPIATYSN